MSHLSEVYITADRNRTKLRMIARHWTLSRIAGRCMVMFIELSSLEDGRLNIEEYDFWWWGGR